LEQEFRYLALITMLPIIYFGSVYFAVSALFPTYALGVGLLAAMFSLGIYLLLFFTKSDKPGMPLGLLILLPVVCVAAGALWWFLRWLGFWKPLD